MKLMVIDGNSILNRAYYGIRPLTTRDGLYTHAIFGFLTTLLRLEGEEAPDALCVTFDVHAPTFRHQASEAYKATRKPMPEELRMQVPVLKEVLDALRIPRYELEGWEADDLIGTISRRCEADGWDCVVVTGDKDSLQLITDRTMVKLVSTRMGQTVTRDMTEAAFREQYGFAPIHMIDLKALMGDSSDNIPGVPGIGEKTAMALIQQYESIDNLYARMPDIDAKPAAVRKLAEGEKSARESYWLATIVTDAPLEFRPEDNLRQQPGPDAYPLFLKLEFTKLIEKFGLAPAEAVTAEKPSCDMTVEQVTDPAQVERLLAQWRQADHVAVLALPDLTGLSVVCWTGENTGVTAELFFEKYQGDWNALLTALFSADIRKVSHNVKDLMRTLLENHLPAEGFVFDTALAAYLLDATAGSYDLARLFVSYFNEELPKPLYLEKDAFSLLGDAAAAEASFDSYAAAVDALYGALAPRLREEQMWDLYETAELPLCRVLAEMEIAGCRVDAKALAAFGDLLAARSAELEQQIYDLAGEEFNINSPKQLGEILFGKLGLPHGKKTKTGWSTNADVLEKLRYEAPIVGAVLEYRQYAKLKSTYADGLLKAMDPDGRVRTSFQMTVTATGRLSSTEPNLQNIPTRTDLGSEIRKMFIPAEGCVLVDADYSQIELRLLAHISGDRDMQAAFLSGGDFHAETAAKVFHVAPDQVTHEMRRQAKAVNFGIVYGISAFSLSQDIGVSVAEAKAYMEAYFATFPGVRTYMDAIVERAREQGYVETLFHRRRDLPELKSSNFNLRSFGERVALNMPIQGTAADIMKLAMVAVWKRLRAELPEARLVLQVHDELIVECPEPQAERAAALLKAEMENVVGLTVPLTADAHWGKNWLEAKG
ncbi:DNA polymerase I [Oscillibacter valericigenes]|uniref:DNA polymerase I n=1 Tax=Oscillibacter valericigenes TaxID=351091 RepID=A0ABS2FVA7_9FIRM|nr:DNA polymerase I [Oscillibacter valericigenes]MBM6851353.1 DNA polymerase I [Oscillibacter valericigenes]